MKADDGTRLLIQALRRHRAEDPSAVPFAWDRLVAAANAHGLTPIIYRRPPSFEQPSGTAVGEVLRERYVAAAAANMRLLHELGGILRALQAASVRVIPLKGAFLAEAVYGDIALRPMADLDLLVKPPDLPRAIETLRGLGYEPEQPFDPVAQQAAFQDMPPMRKPGGAMVELHWTLVTPLCGARIDERELDGIWGRAVPATVAGEPALALAPEDLLLHICMHASVHHRFADVGLKSFVDITEVVHHYGERLPWQAFTERANHWGVANGVRIALMLAGEWTGCQVPADVWTRLDGQPPDEQTLEWARHKVLEGRPAELVGEFADLEADGGAGGRLSTLRRAAFPSRATMARLYGVPGGSWRVLAYYPYRMWDLWKRYRGAVWKLLSGDPEFGDATRREARLRKYLGWR